MNISPFNRGDYVRLKPSYFELPAFDPASAPLLHGEIGIVTATRSHGDRRPRYVQVNGRGPLLHHSMFEPAKPPFLHGLKLWIRFLLA